jgi:hypothetical protein
MKLKLILLFIFTTSTFAKQITYQVDNGHFKQKNFVYLKPTQKLTLKFDVKNAKSIKWYQIIPNTSKFYKNANHPWEDNPYKWVGFGKINYKKVEIKSFDNKRMVELTSKVLEANRPKNNPFYNSKLGSFWFEAEATLKNGKKLRSRGLKDITYRGLSTKVFRVSYMESNDYIGYLTSFFNVPGIFGSISYQSKNYIGVDCADVLMATSAVMNKKKLKDYNVAMLVNKFKTEATVKIINGTPSKKLKWGKDFQRGDFIAVKYSPKGRFAHIGMLYEDANKNGVLDREDLIINAGPNALHVTPLKKGGFNGLVKILDNIDIK